MRDRKPDKEIERERERERPRQMPQESAITCLAGALWSWLECRHCRAVSAAAARIRMGVPCAGEGSLQSPVRSVKHFERRATGPLAVLLQDLAVLPWRHPKRSDSIKSQCFCANKLPLFETTGAGASVLRCFGTNL